MNLQTYNPKALLVQLMKIEKELSIAIEFHFSDPDFMVSDDLDNAFNDFFQSKELLGNEVGYLSTQLALLHMKREVEKAIEVLIDSNQLRAYYDFVSFNDNHKKKGIENKKGNSKLKLLCAILLGILLTVIFLFYLI
ncbi:hypothetical protein AAW12_24325 [Sphingobacterium sp. Ag1]|uniref:hypothetical protein n=1 Tax=Sphingobacterium sp. Ag1 TaxID=1643451 RepID=UPI000627ECDF|nr:hypothetical protein [Sphingobacterium sp. Ag1]KKO89238.1 hypothetical protein AAW12_24325 [Sphingobacterium sp. Ag1]